MLRTLRYTALFLILAITTVAKANEEGAAPAESKGFNLASYHGKVVYLDFWASWCGPCKKSFPFMNELKANFEDQGLAVVTVNIDTDRAAADKFLKEFPADFEVIYDPEHVIYEQYQLQAMPTSFLFDREGELIGSHLGFKEEDAEQLSAAIEGLLSDGENKNQH